MRVSEDREESQQAGKGHDPQSQAQRRKSGHAKVRCGFHARPHASERKERTTPNGAVRRVVELASSSATSRLFHVDAFLRLYWGVAANLFHSSSNKKIYSFTRQPVTPCSNRRATGGARQSPLPRNAIRTAAIQGRRFRDALAAPKGAACWLQTSGSNEPGDSIRPCRPTRL